MYFIMKLTKKSIILYLSKILEEYLQDVNVFLLKNKNILNVEYIVIKGINLIIHIFKLLIIKTKNLKLTVISTSHAHNMYLEYIDQINKPPIITDLNMIDAIKFVIEKTFNSLNESSKDEFPFGDVITANLDPIIIELLDNLLNKSNEIFNWENKTITIENRYHSIKNGDFIKLLSS